jgi:hypothetical protein
MPARPSGKARHQRPSRSRYPAAASPACGWSGPTVWTDPSQYATRSRDRWGRRRAGLLCGPSAGARPVLLHRILGLEQWRIRRHSPMMCQQGEFRGEKNRAHDRDPIRGESTGDHSDDPRLQCPGNDVSLLVEEGLADTVPSAPGRPEWLPDTGKASHDVEVRRRVHCRAGGWLVLRG